MRSSLASLAVLIAVSAQADPVRLVLGSFESPVRAQAWSERIEQRHGVAAEVARTDAGMHRVVSAPMAADRAKTLSLELDESGVASWPLAAPMPQRMRPDPTRSNKRVLNATPAQRSSEVASASASQPNPDPMVASIGSVPVSPSAAVRRAAPPKASSRELDFQLGLESRSFFQSGVSDQASWHPSLSLQAELYWSDPTDRWSLTATPFARFDLEDSERSHVDARELFVSRVGNDWELHVGARQVFWGVTEFNHLVDIVNQTDLVENIDGEDKLGQPMVSASLVRDWGIVDVFALIGHRERTFPGRDGRLRTVLPVDTGLTAYDDSDEDQRIDAAVRWSQSLGALDLGLYHFWGTSREPILEPIVHRGELRLRPRYTTIDQTGLDAQLITGDTAWKLEAIRRSGFGDSYVAANIGLEHTLVGVFGSRSDLGLVAEYLYDDRGDNAFNTVFERDIALGTRWQLNDAANTHALLGVIWDPDTQETQVSLEAGRQLGEGWSVVLEGRAFGGAPAANPDAPLPALLDPDAKLSSFVQDDYVHLEFVRYF